MQPSIIVHGGACDIPPELHDAHRQGTRQAAEAAWAVLTAGDAALDGVETAMVVTENDETFDAGRGSFLNADGRVELDAGLLAGAHPQVGAVAGVQFIHGPSGWHRNTPYLAHAYCTAEMDQPMVGLQAAASSPRTQPRFPAVSSGRAYPVGPMADRDSAELVSGMRW
jgi:hypothetical protein